jgi:fatty-acyl-CoA synthase
MVFPSRTFDAGNVMEAISNESCTAVHGVPTMFISQLNHPDFHKHDFTQLRTGIMAGASCPVEIMRRLEKEMSLEEITIAYGMTETGPVSFQSDAEDSAERRATTVGRIAPHAEAKIVDTEGNIVSVGEQGELWVKSYSVMAGYWGDSVKTAEVLEGGWMKTGDLATLDEEGYCKIVGRIKDMINRGGEKISPNEIEEFLMKHPDVASAQVFGIPHQRLGEEVCAWIIPKTGATLSKEQITQYCQRSMALEKTPVHIRFVEEFPLTASGKPQKFVMQDEMKSELAKDQFV